MSFPSSLSPAATNTKAIKGQEGRISQKGTMAVPKPEAQGSPPPSSLSPTQEGNQQIDT